MISEHEAKHDRMRLQMQPHAVGQHQNIAKSLAVLLETLEEPALLLWEPNPAYQAVATHESRTSPFLPVQWVDGRDAHRVAAESYRILDAKLYLSDRYYHWIHPINQPIQAILAIEQPSDDPTDFAVDTSVFIQPAGYKSQHQIQQGLRQHSELQIRQYIQQHPTGQQIVGWRILTEKLTAKR